MATLEIEDTSLCSLNDALRILAAVFPNVRPEVFREMLATFSEESRLEVVAEQLLRHDAKWVQGRWRVTAQGSSSTIMREVFEVEQPGSEAADPELVPTEETFRSQEYKRAAKTTLSQEFKNLSRSTIDGVLAEQNYSYTLSRPILLGLAAKSWRISFSTLLSKWRKSNHSADDSHYVLIWTKPSGSATNIPSLRHTGSIELDDELHSSILKPVLDRRRETQETISLELATLLNEQEAESAQAIYECECCFSDATFEAMAPCSEGSHTICFRCIQNAVSEALYGQSWGLNIDHVRSQVACIAPADRLCAGCIPHDLARRAVLQTRGGSKTWAKLEARLADDSLQSSGANYARCPFCSYAELDDLYLPPETVKFRLNATHPLTTLLLLGIALAIMFIFLPQYYFFAMWSPLPLTHPKELLSHAIFALVRGTHLSLKLTCPNPECRRTSCRECKAAWRDPHACHESAALSLRTTVEAARTAALKRTCPRCSLAFVKESGCNKMVCVCGYSMCYVCRQGLGRKPLSRANQAIDDVGRPHGLGMFRLTGGLLAGAEEDAGEGEGEGYRHFCQHFRPAGGKCAECEKCDLYRAEDEDEIVRRAGKRAEKDWRKRQGTRAEGVQFGRERRRVEGLQGLVDWWIAMVLKC